jgi:hypothetical protein
VKGVLYELFITIDAIPFVVVAAAAAVLFT